MAHLLHDMRVIPMHISQNMTCFMFWANTTAQLITLQELDKFKHNLAVLNPHPQKQ